MYKKVILGNLVLVGVMGLVFDFGVLSSFAQEEGETITVTTYYPAPYGVYKEMRAKRVAIGGGYVDPSKHCWLGGLCPSPDISDGADLVVEGNVGIGMVSPSYKLHINGQAKFDSSNAGFWIEANENDWFIGRSDVGSSNLAIQNNNKNRIILEPEGDIIFEIGN